MQNNRPSAIVADDEPLLRQELRDLLGELWPELAILEEARDGVSALHAIEGKRPNVAFLDIRMPKMTGIEVAERVQGLTRVVFVTAYDEHAIAAFETGAIDYVIKPIKLARLASTVARLKAQLDSVASSSSARALPSPLTWIQATMGAKLRFIAVHDVLYFQSDQKYTKVVTATSEAVIRKSLTDLLTLLDPDVFRQVNRGIAINIRHVDSVVRGSEGEMFVKLRDGRADIPVSRSHQSQFRGM